MRTLDITKQDGSVYTVMVDDEDYHFLEERNWHVHKTGYVISTCRASGKRRSIRLHREIMKASEGLDVDHINRNPLDNRKENLRVVPHKKNIENANKRKDNTSGCTGVVWCRLRKKWQSQIVHNQKTLNLGRFANIEDAIAARKAKEVELNWHTNRRA